jgi:hypothetical protein
MSTKFIKLFNLSRKPFIRSNEAGRCVGLCDLTLMSFTVGSSLPGALFGTKDPFVGSWVNDGAMLKNLRRLFQEHHGTPGLMELENAIMSWWNEQRHIVGNPIINLPPDPEDLFRFGGHMSDHAWMSECEGLLAGRAHPFCVQTEHARRTHEKDLKAEEQTEKKETVNSVVSAALKRQSATCIRIYTYPSWGGDWRYVSVQPIVAGTSFHSTLATVLNTTPENVPLATPAPDDVAECYTLGKLSKIAQGLVTPKAAPTTEPAQAEKPGKRKGVGMKQPRKRAAVATEPIKS